MGKITKGSKTISKPFIHNGKKVVKIVNNSNGKTLTLAQPITYNLSLGGYMFSSQGHRFGNVQIQGVLTNLGGNGNKYTETVYGVGGIAYYWEKDTHAGATSPKRVNFAFKAPSVGSTTLMTNAIIKGTGYHGTSGWTKIPFSFKRETGNVDNIIVANTKTLADVSLAGGGWDKLSFGLSGGWIQMFMKYNSSSDEIYIGWGAGSGTNEYMTALPIQFITDFDGTIRPNGWTSSKRWHCSSSDIGGTHREWWSDHDESSYGSFYSASCKLYK